MHFTRTGFTVATAVLSVSSKYLSESVVMWGGYSLGQD